jgi:hypothetical protein
VDAKLEWSGEGKLVPQCGLSDLVSSSRLRQKCSSSTSLGYWQVPNFAKLTHQRWLDGSSIATHMLHDDIIASLGRHDGRAQKSISCQPDVWKNSQGGAGEHQLGINPD